MESLERMIAEHPFCNGLETHLVNLLSGCASNVRIEKDFHLFREGSDAKHFYLIREGTIALEVLARPRPPLVVETVGGGEVLGWSWLVPPYRWHFGARAIEPVRAVAVDGTCLRGKCEKNPHLGYELLRRTLQILSQRPEATRFRMLDLYTAERAAPSAKTTFARQ